MTPNGPGYKDLLTTYFRETLFTGLQNFFSNFGQTYFISLLLPSMALAAGVAYEQVGYIYSLATIASAVFLALCGRVADIWSPRSYGAVCAIVFTLAAFLATRVEGPLTLILAVVMIRWSGQGLLSHASTTALSKRFPHRPGAAFALTSLGFPLGEAILPILITALLAVITFEWIWAGISLLSLLVLLPVTLVWGRLFREPTRKSVQASYDPETPPVATASGYSPPTGDRPFSRRIWRDLRLWLLFPHLMSVGFVMTGLLFYQSVIGEAQGWSGWWWATGLTSFAIVRAVCSLGTGGWLRSKDALPLLVLTKLPLGLGAIILALPNMPGWALLVFFPLCGASMGFQSVVTRTALLELYGPEVIGAAKSASTALAILSTAAAPALYGWLGSSGFGTIPQWVLIGNAVTMVAAILLTQAALPELRRRTPR